MENPHHLIKACLAGDRLSQHKLYEQFAAPMFAVCLRYAQNKEEAEEIVQEGFLQVFKSLKTFENKGSFEGWMKKIMVYSAIQNFRKRSKLYLLLKPDDAAAEPAVESEDILAKLGKKELLGMVQMLPPTYRLIFNLYVFEGYKHKEIAAMLGISEGTSKSNFFDAKVILQKRITTSLKIAKPY